MISDKRHSLLRCAVKLFAKKGVSGTSTGSIAKAAGVAAGTLFNYFPSKGQLVREAYTESKLDWIGAMRGGISEGQSPEETFRSIWIAAVTWALDNPSMYEFCRQFHSLPGVGDAQLQKKIDKEMAFLNDAIDSAAEAGLIADVAPQLRDHFFEAWLDAAIAYAGKVPKKNRAGAIEETFGLLWRAIRTN